jgi:hypothetical protein
MTQLDTICGPALIYLIFSFIQILMDLFKQMYNTAIVKSIVMILFTYLLNALCQRGLSIISWFLVFIPFILMSIIIAMLLFVFGLDPRTGKLKPSIIPNHPTHPSKHHPRHQIPDPRTPVHPPKTAHPHHKKTSQHEPADYKNKNKLDST